MTSSNQVLFLWKKTEEERPERETIEQKVIDLIAAVLGHVDKNRIVFSARLGEDLGTEFLDFYDVIRLIEDEFGIELQDENLWRDASFGIPAGGSYGFSDRVPPGVTVQDVIDCVWTELRASSVMS